MILGKRTKLLVLIVAIMVSLFAGTAFAKTIFPFNGENLEGWEIQGEGSWDVVDGAIHGYKPATADGWGHLVYNHSFTDYTVSLRYKVTSSNSGVYVRTHIGGDFGVDGLQVDIGQLTKDALPMGVTKKEFQWLELPKDSGATPGLLTTDAAYGKWNALKITVKGQHLTTELNGRQIVDMDVPQKWMPAEGGLSFQLHMVIPTFVTPEVEVFFKDIKIITP